MLNKYSSEELELRKLRIQKKFDQLVDEEKLLNAQIGFTMECFDPSEVDYEHDDFSEREYLTTIGKASNFTLLKEGLSDTIVSAGNLQKLDIETLNVLRDVIFVKIALNESVIKDSIIELMNSKRIYQAILQVLGEDHSKLFPLIPKTDYIVSTIKGQIKLRFELVDDDAIYYLTHLEGSEYPPEIPMPFIGNVQPDGEIFQSGDMPIISTKDKMCFGRNKKPEWLSDTVVSVTKLEDLN